MEQKAENPTQRSSQISLADVNGFFERRVLKESGIELKALVSAGLDQLPMPGRGQTFVRWQILAAVAAQNLSLLKLYEGHTDALAILDEIGDATAPPDSLWGTWCAEPPEARLNLYSAGAGTKVRLTGRKAWCSGAADVSHALVSCWNSTNEPCLAAVFLDQSGVSVTKDGWHAVGMADSGSVDVLFDNVIAQQVGLPHAYLERRGFWYGGAGIAACWYGAAAALAWKLHQQAQNISASSSNDAHRLAHLGDVDIALSSAAAMLRESARLIDLHPHVDAMLIAMRARLTVEAAATSVYLATTRALGAGPLCRDTHFAQMAADLPVFLRQSHAERDLALLGRKVTTESQPWRL